LKNRNQFRGSFEIEIFFEIHNFEQIRDQGLGIGQQYELVIFYQQNNGQKSVAQKLID